MLLFSDVHLGLSRKAGTTHASSLLWQEAVYSQAKTVLRRDMPCAILGDLFDKYSNPERIVMQGVDVIGSMKAGSVCLAGNHDVTPNASAVGSLQLLRDGVFDSGRILLNSYGENRMYEVGRDIYAVPHVTTQELFDEALNDVYLSRPRKALFLHCNYDLPEDRLTPTALNLSRAAAERLLDGGIGTIYIGHEHNFRTDFDGRVVIPGSIFPTGFDNMNDKYTLVVHPDNPARWGKTLVWEREEHYLEMQVPHALRYGEEAHDADIQFLRVSGEATPSDLSRLWKLFPGLLALKWDRPEVAEAGEAYPETGEWDLRSRIESSITDKRLRGTWDEALRDLEEDFHD